MPRELDAADKPATYRGHLADSVTSVVRHGGIDRFCRRHKIPGCFTNTWAVAVPPRTVQPQRGPVGGEPTARYGEGGDAMHRGTDRGTILAVANGCLTR